MNSVLVVVGLVAILQSSAAPSAKVRVFLGATPSKEGFVATNKQFDESYRDIRDEYKNDKAIQRDLEFVDKLDQADLIVEIVDRGLKDTGVRTSSGTVVGTSVIGSSAPVRQKWLLARLVVVGTDHIVELDGHAGIELVTYRNQARSLLRQVDEWVKANEAALAKARSR